jgi:Flp pilus assembly protein TadD
LTAEARASLEGFLAAHASAGADLWSVLGIVQDDAGDYTAGERSHRTAAKLRDGSSPFHNNLGYNLLLQNRKTEAAAEFRRALEIDPSSAIARNNLGIALAGQPAEAVNQLRSVSDPATAHSNLAAVLMEQGDYEAARRELELALGYRKDHPAALHNLQLIAEAQGGGMTLPNGHNDSSWRRFVRTLGNVFLGADTLAKPVAGSGATGVPTAQNSGSQ